jgi:protein arginine kinase
VTIEDIARSEGIWSVSAQDSSDIVLKSSLKFFRNVEGYPFPQRLEKKEKEQLSTLLVDCIKINEIYSDLSVYNIDELLLTDRKILYERNIIKDERVGGGTLVIDSAQNYYFFLCDSDHVDFIAEKSGFCFEQIYSYSKTVLFGFGKKIDFAFSPKYGYLTANPRHAGPALQLRAYLHLPALVFTGRINEIAAEFDKKGLGVRSSWVEGYYEIYSKSSLGLFEKDLVENAVSNFRKVEQLEREARETEYSANKTALEDKIWRSYGVLLSARLLSLYEALELLSSLRLGIGLGLMNNIMVKDINVLLYFTQDFHLRERYNIKDPNKNMDETRAQFLREYLKEVM